MEGSLEERAAHLGNYAVAAFRLGESPAGPVPVQIRQADSLQSRTEDTRAEGFGRRLKALVDGLTGLSGLTTEAATVALRAWSAEQRDAAGAVVSASVGDRMRIHLVDHTRMTGWSGGYATVCGWTFGASFHMRTAAHLATCRKCLAGRRRREAGGEQAAGLC